MANVFDQFDQKKEEQKNRNVFDQFDEGVEEQETVVADEGRFSHPGAALGDAAISVGSSLLAEPIAGLAGIAGTLLPGEQGQGARFTEATRDFIAQPPTTPGGQKLVETIGKGAETLTKAARAPVAGIAGIASLPQGVDVAADRVRRLMTEGIGPTAGGATLEATGSPLLASAVETLPAAVATAAGARSLRPKAPKTEAPPRVEPTIGPRAEAGPTTRGPNDTGIRLSEELPETGSAPTIESVNVTPYETIVKNIRKGKTGKVAEAVIPDRQIVESAQRLGVDLNPEHYATNAGFQDVARALKTRPGSKLEVAERKALTDLGKKADEVVTDIGGSLDKATVSDDILLEVRGTIRQLGDDAEIAYDAVNAAIPRATRVNPEPIQVYLGSKIADFGGDSSLLSSAEKQLMTLVRNKDGVISPTYAALDRVRKNVGNGFRNRGPFADDDVAILSEVYGLLTDVQDGVAQSFGVGETYTLGKQLVAKRKAIEDAAVNLFGRDLTASLVPKMRAAATGLSKGDVGRFNKLMEALPESRRGEVAATILGDLFSGGSRRGGELGQGFVATWQALNRNKAAKDALFHHLPEASQQRFDDIGRVLTGIVRANQKPLANPSGSAGPIVKALEDGSALSRIYEGGKKIAAAEGVSTAVGVPGVGSAGAIGVLIAKQRTPIIVAADEMLSSPAFARSVERASTGQAAQANKIIESSGSYKKWFNTLDKSTQAKITRVGFISWLISENQ